MDKRALLAFFLILFLCGGCAKAQKQEIVRVVTAIEITATKDGALRSKIFTDGKTMGTVLQYLRKLDPYTPTDISPDSFRTDAYQITVSYSHGEDTVYRQIYDRYFQLSDGSWRLIDPQLGDMLSRLLEMDTETACIF